MKKIIGLCVIALLLPYIITLAWTGRVEGSEKGTEEYLIGIIAAQIDAGYEKETLKAQAIIARTYLHGQVEKSSDGQSVERERIEKAALNVNRLEIGEMEDLWGKEEAPNNYQKISDAVRETKGMVIQYDGGYIEPLFHKVSAGVTRAGDETHPYLCRVETPEDVEAENYISIIRFSKADFARRLNQMKDSPELAPKEAFTSIQIVKKDEAEYVDKIQVGSKSYSGEDIAYALGLPSSAFSFEDYDGDIRCTVRGIGHGYGFDQYNANLKAKAGWTAEELLKKYYKNIIVISE
ncbi:MAG: SpoIID/LytB domain-containing protein [Clostridium sp.]